MGAVDDLGAIRYKAMATSKQKRKTRHQILALLLAVVLVVALSLGFQYWWNNRPATAPADITISVTTSDGQEFEVAPYTVCEVGESCDTPDEVTTITLPAAGSVTLHIPEEIADHDWNLLQIYDDPALNDQFYYAAHERDEITLEARVAASNADEDQEADADADASATSSTATTTASSTSEANEAADNDDDDEAGYTNLVVAEINTLLIDHDDAGEEIPVNAVWSIAFEPAS